MCAEKTEQQEVDVYMSRRFEKYFDSLTEAEQKEVDEQIELIMDNPEIGEKKKGDLDFLRVHKFRMNNQQYLLAYSWVEQKVEIYLLSMGSHENFYDDQQPQQSSFLEKKNHILPSGSMSDDEFWCMIELTPIRSDKIIRAVAKFQQLRQWMLSRKQNEQPPLELIENG